MWSTDVKRINMLSLWSESCDTLRRKHHREDQWLLTITTATVVTWPVWKSSNSKWTDGGTVVYQGANRSSPIHIGRNSRCSQCCILPSSKNALEVSCVGIRCWAQLSFSSMKRLKTPLRNMMNDDRLSSLSVLHIQKGKEINVESVLAHSTKKDTWLFAYKW